MSSTPSPSSSSYFSYERREWGRGGTKSFAHFLTDRDHLKTLTLSCLESVGSKGADFLSINRHVITGMGLNVSETADALNQKKVKDLLANIRSILKEEGVIGYNTKQKVWYKKKTNTQDLTPKEQAFLTAQGLGPGWRSIPDKMFAIKWLHENLSPDEFERFCIAILNTHCGVSVKITEKNPISGADDGFDGFGIYEINGKPEEVGVQVKRISLSRQVTRDECDKFAGASLRKGLKYGFFITTTIFSKSAHESVKAFERQGLMLELIDGDRLAEIMIYKTNFSHGFGLHRTDYGRIYINEEMLRKATQIL